MNGQRSGAADRARRLAFDRVIRPDVRFALRSSSDDERAAADHVVESFDDVLRLLRERYTKRPVHARLGAGTWPILGTFRPDDVYPHFISGAGVDRTLIRSVDKNG